MEVLTMKELLETGVHFGHRTRKWNPKMARYIFTERKGIHIIDLEQTVEMFKRVYYAVRNCVANGGEIVFVGTKKQVQATIVEEAQRCGAHYVSRRWLGGTLTNFATVRQSIERMKRLEAQFEDGSVDHLPNKEASKLRRELAKLQRNLDGLRRMEKKPDLMYVIDPDVEAISVREANIVGIPVIAIVDTNCDPDPIDFLIPGNDDAIKATKLITARIADAVLEGREGRQDEVEEAPDPTAVAAPDKAEAPAEAAAEVAETESAASKEAVASEEPQAEAVAEPEAAEAPAQEEPAAKAKAEDKPTAEAETAEVAEKAEEAPAEEPAEADAVEPAEEDAAEPAEDEDDEAEEADDEEEED